ncbi:hypothetical protein B7486_53390 [cyanobacterium TDX16]|nr:hypothetical protein B7486_53390 [cyanobacterium TDX16]
MGRDRRWPDEHQRLALVAATAESDDAEVAWRRLADEVDVATTADEDLVRLLPLVWRNIGERLPEAERAVVKAHHRRCWLVNQARVRHATGLLADLVEAGIEVLVLKGLALSILFYGDLAVRPMGDVDLLVRPEDARRTVRLLERLGYTSTELLPEGAPRWQREGDDAWYERLRHARGFRRDGGEIDVHWTLSLDFVAEQTDAADVSDLWAASVPLEVGGVATSTLSPTHHLVHAVVHGLSASSTSQARWVADAATIVRTAGDEVDWDEVVAAGTRHGCTLMLRDGIGYLVHALGVDVPDEVVARLDAAPVGRRERALRWVRANAGSPLIGSGYAVGLFVTSTAGRGPVGTAGQVPRFLADYWNVEHAYQVPLVALAKAGGRGRGPSGARGAPA